MTRREKFKISTSITILMVFIILLCWTANVQGDPNPIRVVEHHPEGVYDFIVVGAGAGGCVVARRLSEKFRVLLIEFGGDPNPGLDIPAISGDFFTDQYMHFYNSVPQENAALRNNGTIIYLTGKTLGGGTAVNTMFFNRGNPNDYDNWANITGDPSWGYREMLTFFKRIEDYHGGYPFNEFHARGGPIYVSRPTYAPGLDTWLKAGESLGFHEVDPNALQMPTFIPIEFNKRRGKRVSAYRGYVEPALGHNLQVAKNAKVNKILFEGKRAVGVQFVDQDSGQQFVVRVSKEVIVSAGSLSSPVILMKSGIGPKEHLRAAGIPLVKDLPVGRNLHDHCLLQMSFNMNKNKITVFDPDRDLNPTTFGEFNRTGEGPYSCYNGLTAQAFIVSSVRAKQPPPSPVWPDLHLILMQTPSNIVEDSNGSGNDTKTDPNIISISVLILLTRILSRGTLSLNVTDIEADPLIDFRYLTHPEDMAALVNGFEQVLYLFENTAPYRAEGASYLTVPLDFCKQHLFRSRNYWECYIRFIADSGIHAAGTCRMGRADDPNAVLDTNLKVIGIENVRVADASVMPVVTNANTQVPSMVIGEKAADAILKFWMGSGTARARSTGRQCKCSVSL